VSPIQEGLSLLLVVVIEQTQQEFLLLLNVLERYLVLRGPLNRQSSELCAVKRFIPNGMQDFVEILQASVLE